MLVETATIETGTSEQPEPKQTVAPLRRAHDRIIEGTAGGRHLMIFDEFWREGELALLFGAPGTGKTTLATCLANALACEGDIPWFKMETGVGRSLYVDLSMSDRHFAQRYIYKVRASKIHTQPVSRRFYCDRPADERDLLGWLEERIPAENIKYVVIDDLSAVMRTCDGTRETVAVMRGLRRIRDRFGISILVLMQSADPKPGQSVSEKDLGRQRALCRLADSVFGIGWHPQRHGKVYLAQTRSHSGILWTLRNSMLGALDRKYGNLRITFDTYISPEERRLIKAIRKLRMNGKSFRTIAAELRISKSRAARLAHRWPYVYRDEERRAREKKAAEEEKLARQTEDDDWYRRYEDHDNYDFLDNVNDDDDADSDEPSDDSDRQFYSQELLPPKEPVGPMHGPEPCPFLYDRSDGAMRWLKFLAARHPDKDYSVVMRAYIAGDEWCRPPGSVPPIDPDDPFAGMEVDVDALGNVKYVEERLHDGVPSTYYAYRPNGRLYRFTTSATGASGVPANANLFGNWADVGKGNVPRGSPFN